MKRNDMRFLQPVFALADKKRKKSHLYDVRLPCSETKAKEEIEENDSESLLKKIPPEFDAKEYVSFLLHINSEIEHGLMVQYLYGAYSLGGE